MAEHVCVTCRSTVEATANAKKCPECEGPLAGVKAPEVDSKEDEEETE